MTDLDALHEAVEQSIVERLDDGRIRFVLNTTEGPSLTEGQQIGQLAIAPDTGTLEHIESGVTISVRFGVFDLLSRVGVSPAVSYAHALELADTFSRHYPDTYEATLWLQRWAAGTAHIAMRGEPITPYRDWLREHGP